MSAARDEADLYTKNRVRPSLTLNGFQQTIVLVEYGQLDPKVRRAFEDKVSAFDFSRFEHPEGARATFERRLFGAIGDERLIGDYAQSNVFAKGDRTEMPNERPFAIETGWRGPPIFRVLRLL